MTPEYFQRVSPTYIENWPEQLYGLSIEHVDIPMTIETANFLGRKNGGYRTWFKLVECPAVYENGLLRRVEEALAVFKDGAFVRLGSRSAKDTDFAQKRGSRITRPEDAISLLTDSSKRISFDLRMAIGNNYEPHIFVRKWVDIPKWTELRCFMKNRKLIGISQYDCKNIQYCPEIMANAIKIKSAIHSFFEKFRAMVHLDDVVFDVFVIKSGPSIEVKLLELNPFFVKTDACLFSWDKEDDFDGSFRFFDNDHRIGLC